MFCVAVGRTEEGNLIFGLADWVNLFSFKKRKEDV
jgi:hypothetical protein